jgi:transposase
MLSLNGSYRYYLCRDYTDLRKGFDSLSGIVRNELSSNPMSGAIFIFFNRRRNQVKLLHWEGDGFSIYYKRLERGTYELPDLSNESKKVEVTNQSLMLILQGISLRSIKRRTRYSCSQNMDNYVGVNP